MLARWSPLLFLVLVATACYDGWGRTRFHGNSASSCGGDLAQAPAAKRFANANAAEPDVRAWCSGGAAYRVACPGGGTSLYGQQGDSGESWWFDAAGRLVGYEAWSPAGACSDRRYGFAPDCPSGPSDVSLCTTAVIPDASAVIPDASAVIPDASAVIPDASAVIPDAAVEVSQDVSQTSGTPAGSCASQADCSADTWCNQTGCGFTLGQCVPRPKDCTGYFSPVCGCDGKSYDSACHAQLAGKAIAAYSAPCLGQGCAPACGSGMTCVDCGSAGVQCLAAGGSCGK